IGQYLHNDRDTTWSVSFIRYFFKVCTFDISSSFINRTLNVIFRHIVILCFFNRCSYRWVHVWVPTAFFSGYIYLSSMTHETLTSFSVLSTFLSLYITPLGMTSHWTFSSP